ncbi:MULTISPECIES: helix-turn-helix transcriptional regulator [unclassified Coleofasciculus]|uniref:helix-turn-helix transcriptional regulator n=1 Tax=unclassified Coleofasciculus TaxID=2692782 RepID=UPI0018807F01|nr:MULTISPECIES: helix-turn-helix transcriptional regulator [unclassified Coleofasciculus]MBE9125414.1 helix-turn-helix transcriptional regulator [Coleofasciculus sp. LEGE 07081]MBE9147369.1 helix-turn-helix transcriptional regulator [Coleofasciculus sp. LEGE 07092]
MKRNEISQECQPELKKLREQSGLSQAALAKLVGVTGKTVSNWERGVTPANLTLYQMKDLCSALGVTLEEFTELFGSVQVDD